MKVKDGNIEFAMHIIGDKCKLGIYHDGRRVVMYESTEELARAVIDEYEYDIAAYLLRDMTAMQIASAVAVTMAVAATYNARLTLKRELEEDPLMSR